MDRRHSDGLGNYLYTSSRLVHLGCIARRCVVEGDEYIGYHFGRDHHHAGDYQDNRQQGEVKLY